MIREKGVVVEVLNAETARIAMEAATHARCGSCGLCKRGAAQKVLFVAHTPVPLAVGDSVTVEIPVPGAGWSSVWLLLVPLVMFIAGVGLGEWLRARGTLAAGPWVSVLAGAALMAVAYLAAAAYDRHLRHSPKHQPRIVEWPGNI